MGSIFAWVGGTLGVVIFLIVGLVQIYAGYLGIEYHLGSGWSIYLNGYYNFIFWYFEHLLGRRR